MKTKYYYKKDDKNIYLSQSQFNTCYFLSGYNKPSEAGFLYYCTFIDEVGTCLLPVFKNGKNIIIPEHAGKQVFETELKKIKR